MLFTNPRTGKAIAEEIGSQYQPSNTRRSAASSNGQNEPIADSSTRMRVWRLFRWSSPVAR